MYDGHSHRWSYPNLWIQCVFNSVIDNASKPESILKKKNNSVCYYTVHVSVAMGESLTAIDGDENPANLLTKIICSGKNI